MSEDLVVLRLRHGPFWNHSFVAGFVAGPAIAIDPAWDVPGILDAARAHILTITSVLVTHAHHDHMNGLSELVAATNAEVLIHEAELPLLRAEYAGPATSVRHGHELRLASVAATVLHTPGHTPGSVSLSVDGNIFTGDTLMVGSLGRHGAFEGACEQLLESVYATIGALPPETVVHPGHDDGPAPAAPLSEALPPRDKS